MFASRCRYVIIIIIQSFFFLI
uniref:Uncharacterized protein n=1 Tax=Rhizophora mucronata TaxID=61149 RepID=A0A2P2Q5X0_RHIMU